MAGATNGKHYDGGKTGGAIPKRIDGHIALFASKNKRNVIVYDPDGRTAGYRYSMYQRRGNSWARGRSFVNSSSAIEALGDGSIALNQD